MTNEELKKKIAQIIADYFCPQGNEHKKLWGDDRLCYSKMNFAECEWVTECTDALIAAGIGDLSEYKHRADKAERALHILAKNALYSVMQSDGAFVKLCYGADTAKCNACNEKCSTDDVTDEMLAECLVTESLQQAEKELAEEEKE